MSIESWEPTQQAAAIDASAEKLQPLADLATPSDFGNEDLLARLDETAQSYCRALMQLSPDAWADIATGLNTDTLRNLIRLFTIAEQQLPGCEAGPASPVIALNGELKRRGEPLAREELLWIRQHSDNRFLPNGPL